MNTRDKFGEPGFYKKGVKDEDARGRENGDAQKKEKSPSCGENLKFYLWEFCSRTGIHGFNYLGERGRTIIEKIWWLITILIALYLCVTLIIQTYQKWINSPVIVTFATTQTPIWKIPFPAVTICSEVKSRKSRFNYTDIYLKKRRKEELTEKEAREFEYMSMICDSPDEMLNQSLTTTDERAMDFLMDVSPDFQETMFEVYWSDRRYEKVTDLFSPILTSAGLCYTFNIKDRSELFNDIVTNYKNCYSTNGKRSQWSIESGYSDDAELETYPRRSIVSGWKGGLRILFKVLDEDLDYACRDSMQGFKVILHHPAEVPRGRNKFFRVPLGHSVIASIKPNMMTTSGELKNYKPQHRQCYFSNERSLKYFKIYNQQNCLNECWIDFTLEKCGCAGFHMQRNNTTPICSASKLKCIEEATATYLANEVKTKIKKAKKNSKTSNTAESDFDEKCNCYPACNSLEFDAETSQAEWNWKSFLEIERQWQPNSNRSLKESHFARLIIFFKNMQFITSERNELYGQTDFWASCGGLLGLFTGFSFMSAVEILYYLTLRFICNLKKFGRHYWSGAEELLQEQKEVDENKNSSL